MGDWVGEFYGIWWGKMKVGGCLFYFRRMNSVNWCCGLGVVRSRLLSCRFVGFWLINSVVCCCDWCIGNLMVCSRWMGLRCWVMWVCCVWFVVWVWFLNFFSCWWFFVIWIFGCGMCVGLFWWRFGFIEFNVVEIVVCWIVVYIVIWWWECGEVGSWEEGWGFYYKIFKCFIFLMCFCLCFERVEMKV